MKEDRTRTLQTPRLILRPWRTDDAEHLYEAARNPHVGPAAGWPVHQSAAESRQVIETILSGPYIWAVCLKEDHIPIGCLDLKIGTGSHLNLDAREAELGYWLAEPFWGRGLIPEAAAEIIRHGFEDLRLKRIWCGYFEGNDKSRRVQEKCGFVYHHTTEDLYWPVTGETKTEHISVLDRPGQSPV